MTNRMVFMSLFAAAAAVAWLLIGTRNSVEHSIPVQEAAAKLQKAWADHHTTA